MPSGCACSTSLAASCEENSGARCSRYWRRCYPTSAATAQHQGMWGTVLNDGFLAVMPRRRRRCQSSGRIRASLICWIMWCNERQRGPEVRPVQTAEQDAP